LQSYNSSDQTLLSVDISFDFCIGEPALALDQLGSGSFDAGFDSEIQKYETMSLGTARVTRITLSSTSTTTTKNSVVVVIEDVDQDDEPSTLVRLWWVWWFLLIPLALAACCVWLNAQRKRVKTAPCEEVEIDSVDGPPRRVPSGPLQEQLPRVSANVAFRRDDITSAVDAEVEVLVLEAGELLEVMMNAGEWLYGRRLRNPDQRGYFPESHVSWLGRPVTVSIDDSRISTTAPETIGNSQRESDLREAGRDREGSSAIDLPRPPPMDAPNPSNTALGHIDGLAGVVTGTPVPTPRLGSEPDTSLPAVDAESLVVTESQQPMLGSEPRGVSAVSFDPSAAAPLTVASTADAEPVFRLGSQNENRLVDERCQVPPTVTTVVVEPPSIPPAALRQNGSAEQSLEEPQDDVTPAPQCERTPSFSGM
jgi:hypothetical protein